MDLQGETGAIKRKDFDFAKDPLAESVSWKLEDAEKGLNRYVIRVVLAENWAIPLGSEHFELAVSSMETALMVHFSTSR